MAEKLFTVSEVADYLKCSTSLVYGLLADGSIKYYGLTKGQGGKRISDEQLQEYLRNAERGGGAAAPVSLRDIKHASARS